MSADSRKALLQPLAEVEAALQQALASRTKMGQASELLRKGTQGRIEQIGAQGIHLPENQDALKEALLDRRRCDLVSGMTDLPQED